MIDLLLNLIHRVEDDTSGEGMSTRFGAMFLGTEERSFLGDSLGQPRSFSETTALEVDEEIRTKLENAYARARAKLVEHCQALERLVQALLKKEQIQGDEVYALLPGEGSYLGGQLLQ